MDITFQPIRNGDTPQIKLLKQYNNEMARNRVITLRYVNAMVNAILSIIVSYAFINCHTHLLNIRCYQTIIPGSIAKIESFYEESLPDPNPQTADIIRVVRRQRRSPGGNHH